MRVTVLVDAPVYMAEGIKEDLGMYLEAFGDARVESVVEVEEEQIGFDK